MHPSHFAVEFRLGFEPAPSKNSSAAIMGSVQANGSQGLRLSPALPKWYPHADLGSTPIWWIGSQQAKPERWLQGGELELFFDDTEIEVEGHKFEGARGQRVVAGLWVPPLVR